MTDPLNLPRVTNRGKIGGRQLHAVQTFDVARLATHPVPIVLYHELRGSGPLPLISQSVAVAEFPGGHNGNTSHPMAYAVQLRKVLTAATG